MYRTYNTQGRRTEQIGHAFGLTDLLPYGRQEVAGLTAPSPVESFTRYATPTDSSPTKEATSTLDE